MRFFIPIANIQITVFLNPVQDTNNQRENLDLLNEAGLWAVNSIESKLNIWHEK